MRHAANTRIPGIGTFFVGIDVKPGRYRCRNARGGWWVRFTGPGGGDPVGAWPLPAGPTEVEIAPDDFAFETHVGTEWVRVGSAREPSPGDHPFVARPAADPSLRGDLDRAVARQRPVAWMLPMFSVGLGLGGGLVLGPLWLITMCMVAVMLAVGTPGFTLDLARARELENHRDRYVLPEDLDQEALELLSRTQRAIDAVQDSEVNTENMLDSVDNEVTLPRHEWEIARILARQSRLRAEQAVDLDEEPPEFAAALRPLREKLDISVRAVTRRVEALERYAERARRADEALLAQRRLEALTANAHEYDDLVADSVRDDLAVPAIDRLTAQGDELVRRLRERLTDAAEAADELPPPAGTPRDL